MSRNSGRQANNIDRHGPGTQSGGQPGQPGRQNHHNCYEDELCEVKWRGLGCRELYKIPKVEDRNAFLKAKGLCIRCGSSFRSRALSGGGLNRHRCEWRGWKEKAKCVEVNCYWGAAMCQAHKPNNLSP